MRTAAKASRNAARAAGDARAAKPEANIVMLRNASKAARQPKQQSGGGGGGGRPKQQAKQSSSRGMAPGQPKQSSSLGPSRSAASPRRPSELVDEAGRRPSSAGSELAGPSPLSPGSSRLKEPLPFLDEDFKQAFSLDSFIGRVASAAEAEGGGVHHHDGSDWGFDPAPMLEAFRGAVGRFFHCLSLRFRCLSLAVHCLSLAVYRLSLAVHRLSLRFHCLSLRCHCLSLAFRCLSHWSFPVDRLEIYRIDLDSRMQGCAEECRSAEAAHKAHMAELAGANGRQY